MLKRIWAVVSDADFYDFQQRAKKDGIDMGQALASVAHVYAIGQEATVEHVKKHADRLDYLKAREETSGNKPHLKDVQG